MNETQILFPIVALVALTFAVGIRMGLMRMHSVKSGDLPVGYFKYIRGGKPPEYLQKCTNNYHNLLEMPVVFYLVSVLIYVTNSTDVIYLTLCWVFVFLRYVHSFIHLTTNNVLHRRNTFLLSVLILMIIWVRFAIHLISL